MGILQKIARSQEQLVALYLSPATLSVAVVEEGGAVPRVHAFDFQMLQSADEIHSWLEHPQQAAEAIRRLLKRNRIRRTDAAISIPTHDVVIRTATIPLMSETEFQSAATLGGLWDAFAWMPPVEQEHFVDFIAYERDEETHMMQVAMVAAPLQVVEQYTRIVSLAGLTTVLIDTDNFAIWRALNRWNKLDRDSESVICEMVSSGDFVTVLKGGIPDVTEIFGMDQLRQQLIVGAEMAESERRQLFDSYAAQISSVVESSSDFLPGEPVEENSTEEKPQTTVITLSEFPAIHAAQSHFDEALQEYGMVLSELVSLFKKPKIVAEQFQQQTSQAALLTTLGLGLRRLEVFSEHSTSLWGTRSINLLPNHKQLRQSRKRRFLLNFWSSLIGIPLLAGMVWLFVEQSTIERELRTELIEYERLNRSIQGLNEQLSRQGVELKALNQLIEVAGRVGNNYALTYETITEVTGSIPLGVRLDQLEWQGEGILQIRGVAESDREILALVERLRAGERFQRVSLTTIEQEVEKTGRNRVKERGFLLECEVSDGD